MVLISTPRRFGKTISVSMFAAAMLYSAPAVELSIYSTCKRISQKLLRGVVKFFYEICGQDLGKHNFRIRRQNMEEIVLVGPEGERDVRIVNSYPSKVRAPHSLPRTRRTPRRAHNTLPRHGRRSAGSTPAGAKNIFNGAHGGEQMAELAVPQFPPGPQNSTFENFGDQRTVDGPDDHQFCLGENVDVCIDEDCDLYTPGQIVREDVSQDCFFVRFNDPNPGMNDEGLDYRDMRVPRTNPTNIRKRRLYVPRPSHVPVGPENPYTVRKHKVRPKHGLSHRHSFH